MFEKILVATDSPTIVDGALFTAAELAGQNASELCILHVLESSYSGKYRQFVKHFKSGKEIVTDEKYEQTVKKEMERTFSELIKPLGRHTITVRLGIPWEQILKWAREKKADLIVLGAHTKRAEHTGFARVTGALGSTIEGVILHERCPVMIVNEPARKEQLRFRQILVPVDFSESCEYALQYAVDLAEKHGGRLIVFHMFHEQPAKMKNEKKYNTLRATLENMAKDLPQSVPCAYEVRGGIMPSLEILKFGAEKGVDLIVMGSHTRKQQDRPYVGSVVVQVSCQSLRPVMVVNASKALSASRRSTATKHLRLKTENKYQPAQSA